MGRYEYTARYDCYAFSTAEVFPSVTRPTVEVHLAPARRRLAQGSIFLHQHETLRLRMRPPVRGRLALVVFPLIFIILAAMLNCCSGSQRQYKGGDRLSKGILGRAIYVAVHILCRKVCIFEWKV